MPSWRQDKGVDNYSQSVPIRTQVISMSVILKDTVPPVLEVAELGYAAVAV